MGHRFFAALRMTFIGKPIREASQNGPNPTHFPHTPRSVPAPGTGRGRRRSGPGGELPPSFHGLAWWREDIPGGLPRNTWGNARGTARNQGPPSSVTFWKAG